MGVVATAADAAEAHAVVAEHRPDVAVLDPRLDGGGVDLCAKLRAISPETKCLVHSTGAHDEGAGLKPNGVRWVVFKQLASDQLIAAIRQLATGPSPAAEGPADDADPG